MQALHLSSNYSPLHPALLPNLPAPPCPFPVLRSVTVLPNKPTTTPAANIPFPRTSTLSAHSSPALPSCPPVPHSPALPLPLPTVFPSRPPHHLAVEYPRRATGRPPERWYPWRVLQFSTYANQAEYFEGAEKRSTAGRALFQRLPEQCISASRLMIDSDRVKIMSMSPPSF